MWIKIFPIRVYDYDGGDNVIKTYGGLPTLYFHLQPLLFLAFVSFSKFLVPFCAEYLIYFYHFADD